MSASVGAVEPVYSIVVPVYDSTRSVVELVERVDKVFRGEGLGSYEVILVDDASPNRETWPTLESLARRHPAVRAVQLMRNFGKAGAVLCGFAEARGRYVVTLDDDLQQPPEDIPLLLEHREHDVVIGCFPTRRDPWPARLASRVKGSFDTLLLDKPRGVRMGPLKLLKSEVVRAMLEVRTPHPFLPGLICHVTRDVVNVDVHHRPRAYGRSGFTFRKKLRQFLALLINNSSFLLRVVAVVGTLMATVSVALGVTVVVRKLFLEINVAGWASLAVISLFTGGLVLFSLGVIGEYLIRIIDGIEARAPYIVRRRSGEGA